MAPWGTGPKGVGLLSCLRKTEEPRRPWSDREGRGTLTHSLTSNPCSGRSCVAMMMMQLPGTSPRQNFSASGHLAPQTRRLARGRCRSLRALPRSLSGYFRTTPAGEEVSRKVHSQKNASSLLVIGCEELLHRQEISPLPVS